MTTATRAERADRAGRRRISVGALLLGLTLGLTSLGGCSTTPLGTRGAAASTVTVTATQTLPASTPAAEVLRDRVLAATRALHSYAFVSSSILGTHKVSLRGRAVLPDQLMYDVVSGAKHESVLRFGQARYVRIGTGVWHHGTMPKAPEGSPIAGLIRALQASDSLTIDTAGRLVGTIRATDAASTGLLKTGASATPITATFTLDQAGHVAGLQMQTKLKASGRTLAFQQTTSYGSLDRAPAIPQP